jgi:hypothetical protein
MNHDRTCHPKAAPESVGHRGEHERRNLHAVILRHPWRCGVYRVPNTVSTASRLVDGLMASAADDRRGGVSWPMITQIYEGTNQIQRMVMARALLKG